MSQPRRRFLLEQWNVAVRTLPPMPGDVKKWSRRMFYAGAHQVLIALANTFDVNSPDPTAGDLQLMDDIQAEAEEFAAAIVRGEA